MTGDGEVVAPGDDLAAHDGGEPVVAVGGAEMVPEPGEVRGDLVSATSAERTPRTAASRYRSAHCSIESGAETPRSAAAQPFVKAICGDPAGMRTRRLRAHAVRLPVSFTEETFREGKCTGLECHLLLVTPTWRLPSQLISYLDAVALGCYG